MPKDEFDPEDPLEAVAVELTAEEDTLTPMAECFIEEFMRMGYSAEKILGLFTNPMYAGPLLFTQARGTAAVKQLIADTFRKWGREPNFSRGGSSPRANDSRGSASSITGTTAGAVAPESIAPETI